VNWKNITMMNRNVLYVAVKAVNRKTPRFVDTEGRLEYPQIVLMIFE